ncbi:MAG: sugar phosphate isomerase/epimerase family protein [Sphingomonadales bacterium]|jgi:hypothetical protein
MKLDIYQSHWAMELRRPDGREYGDETSFQMVADAGFQGMCLDPAIGDIDNYLKLLPFFKKHDLKCLVNAFPSSIEELRPLLEFAKEFDAPFVNIIGTMYPLEVKEALPIIKGWMEISEDVGVPILIETHRDCITNDMFFTLLLMNEIPDMRLCADLSHYVVGREMGLPITDEFQAHISKIIKRSDCFQGRVANREQVQISITFPQHQEWFNVFKGWWEEGLRDWRARASIDDTLVFLCELGPPDYAITGKDGMELSDRWEEALLIKRWVKDIWMKLEAES